MVDQQSPVDSAPADRCCVPDPLFRGLAALAHPARIEILRYLSDVDTCCCKDVVGRLHLAQSTVSQHLKVLTEAGLVEMRPEAQRSCYTVNKQALTALSQALGDLVATCVAQAPQRGKNI